MDRHSAAVAATRFGMGAQPGEIDRIAADPKRWLLQQIRPDAALTPAEGLSSTVAVLKARADAYPDGPPMQMGENGQPQLTEEQRRAVRDTLQKEARDGLAAEGLARLAHAVATPDSFAERWARFWANHFTAAARNAQMIGLAGPFEREAVRPHVFGRFSTLLRASSLHPAMLVYLDAFRSIGPSTRPAQRRDAGLNENLAREILELHTMGVGSGYTQDDIIELAKGLTGWTVGYSRRIPPSVKPEASGAVFLPLLHEPGARKLLGRSYGGDARNQAGAMLDDLARHPATARHVAVKLARHFVADEPPAAAVTALETSFRDSDGDLAALARAVIALPAAWSAPLSKFKAPDDLLVSTGRAVGAKAAQRRELRVFQETLGQPTFRAPSPAGWPDTAADWSGPDAISKRLEWANAIARRAGPDARPLALLDIALGPLASARTREAVSRAESAEQGLTLALMSPEFQRR